MASAIFRRQKPATALVAHALFLSLLVLELELLSLWQYKLFAVGVSFLPGVSPPTGRPARGRRRVASPFLVRPQPEGERGTRESQPTPGADGRGLSLSGLSCQGKDALSASCWSCLAARESEPTSEPTRERTFVSLSLACGSFSSWDAKALTPLSGLITLLTHSLSVCSPKRPNGGLARGQKRRQNGERGSASLVQGLMRDDMNIQLLAC